MENHVPSDTQAFSRAAQSLSSVEKEYYTVLWQAACTQGDILRGKAAFDFLSKSQLPREILKRIWDIADWQKRGLAWEEFVVTLKLISAAQKRQLVSLERVLATLGPTSRDLPTFDGIEAPHDGEAPEAPQKRDVFAEFEALAGIQAAPTQAAPMDLLEEVSHPAADPPVQNLVEEPPPGGGNADWASFQKSDLPAPPASGGAPDGEKADVKPALSPLVFDEAPKQDWAAFQSFDFPAQPAPGGAPDGEKADVKPALSPLVFDEAPKEDWAAFQSFDFPAQPASGGAPDAEKADVKSSTGPSVFDEAPKEDWAAFQSFDFPAQPASGGAPDAEKADVKPSISPLIFEEAPKQGAMPEPFFKENEPEDGGTEVAEDLPAFNIAAPPDGEAPEEAPQKRDVFAEFEALAGIQAAPTQAAPMDLLEEVSHPAADPPVQNLVEEPQPGAEDWASFGTFDFPAQPTSGGAPASEKVNAKPSFSSLVFDEVPKEGNTPEPFFKEDDLEDGGTEVAEARALARSLCSLGRFEEALQCKANGDVLRRLHAAEEKKKEAVAQDDFEGAIKIRSEIKEISGSLVSEQVLEVWRSLAHGERDASLQMAAEQLRQRCQWMDGFSSAALGIAVGNFRRACPEHRENCLPVLPSLVRQQRRARQMYRAIEAISSQNVLLFLQVIFVCIQTLCGLLVESSVQIGELANPDWSDEERQCVNESDELQSLLRGLCSLRRLLWRLGLAAELFMPEGEGLVDGPDAETLQELQASIASSLAKAKASWAKLESDIISLRFRIEPWQEGNTFEAGGCTNGSVPDQLRTAPLCRLCLLPAVPLGMEAEVEERDPGAVSAPWRGGHWHVQCANFWLRHASCSKAFKDLKVEDPFEEYHIDRAWAA